MSSEHVDSKINKENVDIVRQKKNAAVTISGGLNPMCVKEALGKIDFTTSRKLFLRLPLYCRPVRDITPEKPSEANLKPKPSLGTKPKIPASRIPGLPHKAQKHALDRQRKKEIEQKKSTEKEKKEASNKKSLSKEEKVTEAPKKNALISS